MHTELRQLSSEDGVDIYEMLQDISSDENGFINPCKGKTFAEYKQWLIENDNCAHGIDLDDWMVPQSIFWLYADGRPVGMGKLRHCLNDRLKIEGGHAGYAIRAACRHQGYGTLLLKGLIHEASALNIDRLLLTIHDWNTPSLKTAAANGGVIEKIRHQTYYVWVDCPK